MDARPVTGADLTKIILTLERSRAARRAARREPSPGVREELRRASREILEILEVLEGVCHDAVSHRVGHYVES